jgi:tRNA nucleotidyltransferase (CCA-adding enzyme)
MAPRIVRSSRGDEGRCENGPVLDESDLPERVRALPGMEAVLGALAGAPPCHLVGGAVRDLLLEREPLDVDMAVEGDVEAVAARIAAALDGSVTAHDRFGTATVVAGGADAVNLARTRCETYAAPGALPDVAPAPLAEDLVRRDFTVNALALALNGERAWELIDPHGGRGDLRAGLIRVLHPESFRDDPTRLLRAVRYAARLGFELEAETDREARAAIAAGAPATVSGARVRDELMDLLAEHEAPRAVELLRELGLDRALHPDLSADAELVASTKLGAAEVGADPVLAALAALCVEPAPEKGRAAEDGPMVAASAGGRADAGDGAADLTAWIDRLGLGAGERDAVLRAARVAPELVGALRGELRPSERYALLANEPPEALALALGLGAPAEPVLDFVARLSGVRLEIGGDDLIAAGMVQSPALGRVLDETLARKLDGEVAGREDELRVALEIARGES